MPQLKSLLDAPNTSREYETIYILRGNASNEVVADVNTRVKGVIEGMGGKILKVDNWGKRRLAYEIKKERKGIYLHWVYLAQSGVVEEAERNLRMLDVVLRYQTIKVDVDVVTTARPSEIDDTSFDRAAQTAADEEDMFLSRGADAGAADADDGDDEEEDENEAAAGAPSDASEGKE